MNQTDKLNFKLDLQMFAEGDPEPAPEPEKDYLKIIADLKKNTVPKSEYEKVRNDRDKLLNDYLNGGDPQPEVNDPPQKESAEDLRAYLRSGKAKTNLDLWVHYLDLRDAVMEQGEIDPMVPVGEDYTPNAADFETAEHIASEIRECINLSGGDPAKFNELLDAKIIGGLPKAKKK